MIPTQAQLPSSVPVAALLVLLPAAAGFELFSRGAVYAVLERRWGALAAIVGAAVPETVAVATGGGGVRTTASALALGALFGLARWSTGSVAAGVLARLALAAMGAIVMVSLAG